MNLFELSGLLAPGFLWPQAAPDDFLAEELQDMTKSSFALPEVNLSPYRKS